MELKEVTYDVLATGDKMPSGYYLKADVDAFIAEKDKEIAELKAENKLLKEHIVNGDVSRITWIDEVIELKQKLHDAERKAGLAEWANTEYRKDVKKLKEENEILKGREEIQCDYRGHWLKLKGDYDKLKEENERLTRELEHVKNGDCINTCDVLEKYGKELCATRRALWLARAERAEYAYRWWTEKSYAMNALYYTIDGKRYKHGMKEKTLHPSEWADIWLKVKKAIRAKAEEYK